MKIIFILLGIGFLLLPSCSSEPISKSESEKTAAIELPKIEEPVLVDEINEALTWFVYEGEFGNYEKNVVVYFAIDQSMKVTGSYYYSKHQKMLSLSGNYNSKSGNYSLTESYKGKITGYLSFKNQNGNLIGEWKKSMNDPTSQTLRLSYLFKNEGKQPEIEFSSYENQHEIGVYNGDGEDIVEVVDQLFISKINDKFYSFDYSVTGANAHSGSADGIINMEDSKIGHFYGEDKCDVLFTFGKNQVDIVENDCQYYHGARAYLDNTLTKVRKK